MAHQDREVGTGTRSSALGWESVHGDREQGTGRRKIRNNALG